MYSTHHSATAVREALTTTDQVLHDANQQKTTLSHAEHHRNRIQAILSHEEHRRNRMSSACCSTDDDQSDDGDFLDEYSWEDVNGNVHHTKHHYNDEQALQLRKERRRFMHQREDERYQWQMEQMADEYIESQLLQEDDEYNEFDEMDVSPTARMTVSSYMTQRKAHLLRQSRQRQGEGPRSVKARRLEFFSAAQQRVCAARREGRSHKAASVRSQDGLRDLQSFERTGGSLSRWAYDDWFSC